MQFNNFLNKEITITQIKGGSKLNDRQKGSLLGLGLRGIGSSSKFSCTQPILGMVKKIGHVVKISLV
jgi:ribosomal protein L30/L7E